MAQFVFVHRRGNGQIWYRPQVGQVEGTMVRRTVLTDQSGPVQTEHNVQFLNGYIVDDVIIGPLGKRRIDVAERQHAVFGQSAREGYGMALGNTDIEGTFGHFLHHDVQGAARRHGGCDSDDFIVLAGQFHYCMSEYILKAWRQSVGVAFQSFAGLFVEFSRGMPFGGRFFGGFKSFALYGVQMEQLGPLHVLDALQHFYQLDDIMSVPRTEIADIHAFENILLVADERFDGVIEADDAFFAVVVQPSPAVELLRYFKAHPVIPGTRVQLQQIMLHATDTPVDAHVIVVQNNEQIVWGG